MNGSATSRSVWRRAGSACGSTGKTNSSGPVISTISGRKPDFPLALTMIFALIGSLIAVFSSILPAYTAARKQPVEALRVEE